MNPDGSTPGVGVLRERCDELRRAIGQIIVGYDEAIEEILIALLCGGHVLLEGVPGVGKTLLARTLAALLGLEFRRVQFTPDLTPADIIGTNIFDLQENRFRLQKGPVFTNVLLADEINRTSPKTQSALLEAMQERQVTIDGESHRLGDPFFVIATQNPLEHEGTYPLPEAQLDRFLMKVLLDYPNEEDEAHIYRRLVDGSLSLREQAMPDRPVLGEGELPRFQQALDAVHIEDKVTAYVLSLVTATRRHEALILGASPRAGMALLAASRARAALDGRTFVIPDDVKGLALPILRHRLVVTPEAELEGANATSVLRALVAGAEVPR